MRIFIYWNGNHDKTDFDFMDAADEPIDFLSPAFRLIIQGQFRHHVSKRCVVLGLITGGKK